MARAVTKRLAALAAALVVGALAPAAQAAPNAYIEMADGVRLAANLQIPAGAAPSGGWPTVFAYDGYDGGSTPLTLPAAQRDHYATIHVSIRGTGCSGGQFDLFDRRHAKDGYEVVEWISDRPWSNDRVGLIGHSYGGISAMFVAAEAPPHLDAVVASGLIDDLYRGIVYIGGVPNPGFPLIWTGGFRPAVDVATGTAPGLVDGDLECERNLAEREAPAVTDDPIVNGLLNPTDGVWWASHSLYTYLQGVEVPTFVGHAWQDEQTGPRGGPLVFEKLPAGIPKRLVTSNGDHGINGGAVSSVRGQRMAWLDRFVRDVANGIDARPPVEIGLETANRGGSPTWNGAIEGADLPLPGTDWTRYHLRENGGLSTTAPGAGGGEDSYVSGTGRQSWNYFAPDAGGEATAADLPDQVTYSSAPVSEATTIAGPIAATLYAKSAAVSASVAGQTVDTDFFVQVLDESPDGELTWIQRGQLRASYRALDERRSKRNADGDLIRPEHPFTAPDTDLPPGIPDVPPDVRAGKLLRYDIEVFPAAHVFRPGHRIVVKVHSPPRHESLYVYTPSEPTVNTIVHDEDHPSSILLPLVSTPALGAAPGCGDLIAQRCVKPAL